MNSTNFQNTKGKKKNQLLLFSSYTIKQSSKKINLMQFNLNFAMPAATSNQNI